jgi:DNA-binding NtrC family response regulator
LSNAATSSDDDVSTHAVLILSSDPLAAALLGAAVELAGYAPSFAGQGEPHRAALLRLRPRLVLVDCDHEEACSEGFIGPALMTGAKVLVFRSRRSTRDVTDLTARMQVAVMDLPLEGDRLTRMLREALG